MAAIETGSVILIARENRRDLAVVQGRKRVSSTPGWEGYYVWVDGEYESVADNEVLDRSPACPLCGRNQWYLSEGPELYLVEKILCRSCQPPIPQWEEAWRKLQKLLDHIPSDDPVLPSLRQTLGFCDAAFEAGDWPMFKRGAYAIGVAVALRTGLWNPYKGKDAG